MTGGAKVNHLRIIAGGKSAEPREQVDLREALNLAQAWLNLPPEERGVVQQCVADAKAQAKARGARPIQYLVPESKGYNGHISGNLDDPHTWLGYLQKTATYSGRERVYVWSGIHALEEERAKEQEERRRCKQMPTGEQRAD